MRFGLKSRFSRAFAVSGLAVALAAGCAQNVGDVVRVQPGYTKKAIFDPKNKWYELETVTRVDPAVSAYMFEGLQSGGDKIRWMITEKKLVAYRTYETINGESTGGDPAKRIDDKSGLYFGAPIAEYEITAHFDITRDYNPATGEQTNVVGENIIDRPWYEREFMRVNWTKNGVGNPLGNLGDVGALGMAEWGLNATVLEYGDTAYDRSNPNRIAIEDDMIRVPARYHVAPQIDYCLQLGLFDESVNCPPGNVDVTHSFVRVDPNTEYDFQPVYYPDSIPVRDTKGNRVMVDNMGNACSKNSTDASECQEFRVDVGGRFGFFRTHRISYDRKSGYLESNRLPMANIWPIWQGYFARNEDGTFKQDEATGGLVDLPITERTVRTNIVYADIEWPEYQVEMAKKVVSEWNRVFKNVIRDAYLAEAARPGIPSETKSKLNELAKGDIPNVLEFSRNNCNPESVGKFLTDHGNYRVKDGNKTVKLAEVTLALTGPAADGAINVTYGNLANVCSLLEYYTDVRVTDRQARDAKGNTLDKDFTVENRFTWQREGDARFSMLNWVPRDQIAGPLGYGPSFADPETGRIITATSNIYGSALENYAFQSQQLLEAVNGNAADVMLGQDVAKIVDQAKKATVKREANKGLRADQKLALKSRFDKIKFRDTREHLMNDLQASGEVDRRLERLKASGLEDQLITDDLLDLYSNGRYSRDKDSMTAESKAMLREAASPVRNVRHRHGKDMSHVFATRKNALTGSDVAGCYFPMDGMEEMVMQIMANSSACTQAADPVLVSQACKYANVKDKNKVWETIAQDIGLGVTLHEFGHNLGLRHNFSASADRYNYHDKYWDEQKAGGSPLQKEMMYSSIMDYGANFNTDFGGLGKYDQAAIAFAYTGLVQVFDMPNRAKVKYPSIDPALLPDNDPSSMVDPAAFISVGGCEPTKAEGCSTDQASQTWLMDQNKFTTMFGRDEASSIENIKTKRKWVKFADYLDNWRAAMSNSELSKNSVDLKFGADSPNYAIPYAYRSDEYRGSYFSNLPTDVWDHGYTVEDIVSNQIDMYNFRYIFDAFKRDRFGWNPGNYLARLQGRYFYVMGNAYRYFYYANVFFGDGIEAYDFYKDWGKASLLGIGTLSEAITRPEPGKHCLEPAQGGGGKYVPESDMPGCELNGEVTKSINIPIGVGRPLNLGWSNDYNYQIIRLGSMYEKSVAMMALADTEGTFQRFDNGTFFRFSQIGYYRMFKDDILKFYTGLLTTEGDSLIGGKVDKDGNFVSRPMVLAAATPEDQIVLNDPAAPVVGATLHDWNKLIGIMYGMVFMTSSVDSVVDFNRYAQIAVLGSDDDFTTAFPNSYQAQVMNPTNGQVYRAVLNLDLGTIPQVEQSVGFNMIRDAQFTQLFAAAFTRFQTKNHANPSWNDPTLPQCGGPGVDPDACYDVEADDYFIIAYRLGLLGLAVDPNTGEINHTMLVQYIDTLADLYYATKVEGDPRLSPTADFAAQFIGMLLGESIQSKNDPRFIPAANTIVGFLDRNAKRVNKDFVDSLEWVDTVRMYSKAFEFGNGI